MNSHLISYASRASTGHGFTWLEHDINGWAVALIVAIVAAFIYEAAMALTRMVTLRMPFLVLHLAKITMPKQDWHPLYRAWKGELWEILRNREKHWLVRFFKGMAFALPLALGAARATAKVTSPQRTVSQKRPDRADIRRRRAHIRRVRRGRRTSSTALAMRAGVAGGVLSTVAVASASADSDASRQALPGWVYWTAFIAISLTAAVAGVTGALASRNRKKRHRAE